MLLAERDEDPSVNHIWIDYIFIILQTVITSAAIYDLVKIKKGGENES